MRAIETAPHEFTANYLYNQFGLSPYFACDRVVEEGDGSVAGEFNDSGERWVTKLSYQSSNIVHPGETTPRGTEFRIQTIREYRLKVARYPDEDSVGEQDFTAHLAPRWVGMKGESKSGKVSQIPVPEGFGEGVNIRASGSNIEFERYEPLLRLAFEAVGVSGSYFTEIHPYSNILDAERYVRVHKDESGPIHARTGPISSLAHVLEHDRRGRRKLDQRDDDLHQRNLPGFYHTVTLDPHERHGLIMRCPRN